MDVEKVLIYLRKTQNNLRRLEQLLMEEYAPAPEPARDEGTALKVAAVIDMLNRECGTRFSATAQKNVKHIAARIKEGYRFEDFEAVVLDRKKRWEGDPKMQDYLRPETLFGSKFDGYLGIAGKADAPTTKSFNNDEIEAEILRRIGA